MAGGQYPGDLDSFTANVDGVDDVLAADINELQVMGVATQTELGTDPAGSCTDLKTRLAHSINDAGMLEFDDCTELTISGGAVTVTQNYHKIDTEGDAASDDLDTINGNSAGLFIVLRIVADARNVVIKHNTGNILCAGAADITLDTTGQFAFGVYDTGQSKWLIGHGAATGVTGSGADSYVCVYTAENAVEGTDDLQWDGTTLTIGDGTAGRDYIMTFNGADKDGIITWMEDEDYFKFSDDILMNSTEKVQFRDAAVFINSATDGHLDLDADVSIDLNTPAVYISDTTALLHLETSGASDPTIILKTTNTAHELSLTLNESEAAGTLYMIYEAISSEHLVLQTKAPDTKNANHQLYSGANFCDFSFTANDVFQLRNTAQDKDMTFLINDGGVSTEVMRLDADIKSLQMGDACNIVLNTTTGTMLGSAANQKLGFYGTAPTAQIAKADYNNWTDFGDVVDALVALGLFDAA